MVKLSLQCAIVGEVGSSFDVKIDDGEKVSQLKKVIIGQNDDINVPERNLHLSLAKTEGDAWLLEESDSAQKLERGEKPPEVEKMLAKNKMLSSWTIGEVLSQFGMTGTRAPSSKQVHVLVVVSNAESKRPAEDDRVDDVLKRVRAMEPKVAAIVVPRTLEDFQPLSVREKEFQLDDLSTAHGSAKPVVETPDMHEFWKGFGEFPTHYFVRTEEVVFWEVIEKLLFTKGRVVIVGSPGVGKSCFLMLIAFYLACIKKKAVLVIRRLKEEDSENAVVFLDGQGSYARLTDLTPDDLFAIRRQTKGAIVLVDGFDQKQVTDLGMGYGPFKILATSCQFDAKHDDKSRVVVLPAWRDADLLQYAKSTKWVTETGLRQIKRLDTPFQKLVKEQYFYSGGSLREFCKDRKALMLRVARDCRAVDTAQAIDLMYNYGGGTSRTQVDRLRRHYITDYHDEVHYYDSGKWILSVDSGFVLGELGRLVDVDKQLEVYKYAKSVGAGFHGVAYELLLHNAVRGAYAKRKPIVLKMRKGSKYEKIEIRVPNVVCSGEDEASCYPCLSILGKDTYWYPKYPFFPFIDAVTTCEAFPTGSGKPEKIVAFIQVTIASEKKFKEARLRRLDEEMDKNQSLKDMKRAFVIVGPNLSVCEMFNLHDAPDPNTSLVLVSCFSPEQLER